MLVLIERRPDRRQFSGDELTSSARYAGHKLPGEATRNI